MNITFLIGNGFDIGLGLKTRYENFYDVYCEELTTDSDNIKKFKQHLKERNNDKIKKIIDWSDFEKAFGEFSEQFKGENAEELYLEAYENFVEQFNGYLEKQQKLLKWENEKIIFDKMYNGVLDYYKVSKEAQRDFPKFYQSYGTEAVYNFITFNYTNTVDKCVEFLSDNKDKKVKTRPVVHVHGYIEDSMIMGVNDSSQITNQELSKNSNVIMELVKPEQNKNSQTTFDNQATTLIDRSDIICTYGMSIGETDKKWWKLICEWLKQNTHRKLVILKHEKKYSPRFPHNYRKYILPLKEKFLSFSEFDEAVKEKIRSQIYVGINHDVFGINLCEIERKEEANKKNTEHQSIRLTPYSNILAQGFNKDIVNGVEKAYKLNNDLLYKNELNNNVKKNYLVDPIKLPVSEDNSLYIKYEDLFNNSENTQDYFKTEDELIKK